MAIFDVSGRSMRVVPSGGDSGWQAVGGMCLSKYGEESLNEMGTGGPNPEFLDVLADMAGSLVMAAASFPKRMIIHSLEALITYLLGVVRSMQDLMQVVDVRDCKISDSTIQHLASCACGDAAAVIPDDVAEQGLYASAFWCSGTLSMVLSDGSSKVVFNPYSFTVLKALLKDTLDDYLDCISGGYERGVYASCHTIEPQVPYFRRQGVSSISVLTRCRSNYVNRQWDDGSALLFNASLVDELRDFQGDIAREFDMDVYTFPEVTSCMLSSLSQGFASDRCLDVFLGHPSVNKKKSEYFAYETGTAPYDSPAVDVDACEVFTGPASLADDTVAATFGACLDSVSGCEIPYFLWSGRSRNLVPVASPHFKHVSDTGTDTRRYEQAAEAINRERVAIRGVLSEFLAEWKGDGLEVSLFTSEGDALHQALDCMLLGPYASTNMWPSDRELPSMQYARGGVDSDDAGESREFELPCTGDRLHGDHKLPFTCGSTARRAAMKYFVRNHGSDDGERLKEIVVNETIAFFEALLVRWGTDDFFMCPCAGSVRRAIECCTEDDQEGWSEFRSGLGTSLSIPGGSLVASLIDDMAEFVQTTMVTDTYTVFTSHADPVVDSGYTLPASDYVWSVQEALLAADVGLYNPLYPVAFYDEGDVASPMKDEMSLWDLCIAHVSSVFFTLPLSREAGGFEGEEYDPVSTMDSGQDGYMSNLEAYVKRVTLSAYSHSPLYWHHVLRYVPSDSLMCLDYENPHYAGPGTHNEAVDIPFKSFYEDGRDYASESFTGSLISTMEKIAATASTDAWAVDDDSVEFFFKQFGVHYHSFASLRVRCVCGWEMDGGCYITAAVCAYILDTYAADERFTGLASMCLEASASALEVVPYDVSEWAWHVNKAVLDADLAQKSMVCDDMYPSDAWGLVQSEFATDWIKGVSHPTLQLHTTLYDTLTTGRSGIRLGNIMQIRGQWNKLLSPGQRHRPLIHDTDMGRFVVQHWCAVSFGAKIARTDLLDRFVDELFPVAQGVRGGMAVETCTRYMIELARQTVYEYAGLDKLSTQFNNLAVWRRRCSNQLNTVSMCNVRGVYGVMPANRVPVGTSCSFTVIGLEQTDAYVTAGCLVYVGGVFHDPRLCDLCTTAECILTLDAVRSCPLPVDVRSVVKHPEWGGGFEWATAFPDYMNEAFAERLTGLVAELALLDGEQHVPLALSGAVFYEKVYENVRVGVTTSLFNSRMKWMQAEGISKHTESTMFCDSVLDWWPETWESPVGYHVSVPPFADEAGYQVFDNAFVVERGGDFELVKIVYEHDYMRNTTLMQNYFGASGVCGVHSYGMEMRELNNIRACTTMSMHDTADPAVPIKSNQSEASRASQGSWFKERCSDTWVPPWQQGGITSAQTVGLVSHWDDTTADLWPQTTHVLAKLSGLRGPIDTESASDLFGEACFPPRQTTCTSHVQCQSLSLSEAMRDTLRCIKGVCVVSTHANRDTSRTDVPRFDCASHAECSGELMCSGFGMCVPPVVQYTNHLDVTVEAQVYSAQCKYAAAESMQGTSPWESVSDILEGSGMCSYRSWFELGSLFDSAKCGNDSPTCNIDTDKYGIRHSSTDTPVNTGSLWEQHTLRVGAHVCDKDYMHVDGLQACTSTRVLGQSEFRDSNGNRASAAVSRSEFMRTHKIDPSGKKSIELHSDALEEYHNSSYGFLGITKPLSEMYDATGGGSRLQFCASIPQCHLQVITMGGYDVTHRQSLSLAVLQSRVWYDATVYTFRDTPTYTPTYHDVDFQDYFLCGAFGLHTGSECILDPAVTPLFFAMCPRTTDDAIVVANANKIRETCPWTFVDKETTPSVDQFKRRICRTPVQEYQLPFYPSNPLNPTVLDNVVTHLNWVTTSAIRTGFTTFTEYRALTSCAKAIWDAYRAHPLLQHPRTNVRADVDDDSQFVIIPEGLYYYDVKYPHPVTEMPFAWWVKCTLLSSIYPTYNQRVSCPAWSERVKLSDTGPNMDKLDGMPVRDVLRRLNGVMTEEWWHDNIGGYSDSLPVDVCGPNGPSLDTLLNTREVYSLLQYAKGRMQDREVIKRAVKETCRQHKQFDLDNLDNGRTREVERRIHEFYTLGVDVRDEDVISVDEREVEESVFTHTLWQTVCNHWYGTNSNEAWFVEDVNMLERPYSANHRLRVIKGAAHGQAEYYMLHYLPGQGINVTSDPVNADANGVDIHSQEVSDWIATCIKDGSIIGFRSIHVWAAVMVVIQVAALLLLTFEDPGLLDDNNITRYISDNIDSHRGYGAVMLLSFSGSYILLSMVNLSASWVLVTTVLMGGAAFGGTGVVLFHNEFEWQHIGCAAAFIACGIMIHFIVIFTGQFTSHKIRDSVLLLMTFASAGLFGGILIMNRIKIEDTQDLVGDAKYSPRDPRLHTWWWISGTAEYVLYINMCILNLFVGERIFEHTVKAIFQSLPYLTTTLKEQ